MLVGLVLVIALPAALVKPPTPAPAAPPELVAAPELVSATNNSLDFRVAVNQAAVVYYVVVPQATSRRALQAAADWQQYTAAGVRAAAAGLGTTNLEVCCKVGQICFTGITWPRREMFLHSIISV